MNEAFTRQYFAAGALGRVFWFKPENPFEIVGIVGASRIRLARQLLAESATLAAAGAVAGLVFAQRGSALIVRQLSTASAAVFLDLSMDWRVLAFTMCVALATAVLFGLLPRTP